MLGALYVQRTLEYVARRTCTPPRLLLHEDGVQMLVVDSPIEDSRPKEKDRTEYRTDSGVQTYNVQQLGLQNPIC